MLATKDCETCIACGQARAVLVVIAGRRGEYYLCAKCAEDPRRAQQRLAQTNRMGRSKIGKVKRQKG